MFQLNKVDLISFILDRSKLIWSGHSHFCTNSMSKYTFEFVMPQPSIEQDEPELHHMQHFLNANPEGSAVAGKQAVVAANMQQRVVASAESHIC